MSSFLDELNEAQRKAVEAVNGPVMVLAGAGSGKTRVLTYRVAHLINLGLAPFNILALTFTNKAAKEMKERIEKIAGTETRNLWMGTFHSVFARILRNEASSLGYPYNFTIYDTIDTKSLLRSIIKELKLDEKIYKPGLVYNRISAAKNNLLSAKAYNNDEKIIAEDKVMAKPRLGEVYSRYEKKCFKSGAMDFDDLLFKTNMLFSKSPETLKKYQDIFRFILVDEYQDTNFAQYSIIKKLSATHKNICVVGDDAQSIYSFRGADIENILNFNKDFPGAQTFKLEQNYRSTKTIVNAANAVIENNKNQIKKDIWTGNDEGSKIKIIKTRTDNDEGKAVAASILDASLQEQYKYSEFAILYRTNAQSRAMEEALRKNNIPYKIHGGLSFYQRKEIKDLLSYYRLIINPNDEEALKRVINYPARGIGKSTLDKLIISSTANDCSVWEVIDTHLHTCGLNKGTMKKLKDFINMILTFQAELPQKNAYDLGSHVVSHTGILKELYVDKTPEGVSRYENIQELLNGVKQFSLLEEVNPGDAPTKTLDVFMEDVALLTNQDSETDDDFNKVTLMTIHSAKGLEFPAVYIVGLEENLFPSQLSLTNRSELEEERRLFYVALTRAEKSLTISYAQTRFKFGNINYADPSRFVSELPKQLIEAPSSFNSRNISKPNNPFLTHSKSKFVSMNKAVTPTVSTVPNNSSLMNVNTEVEHLRFGKGKIISLEGIGPSKKATIAFDKHGTKQILLKFAKLKILS
ncbi:MAG: DNA helicase-2/ATP-dependent DNA helicase PcrA [Saprospiraceae bacterium]|jgi:DNA helicase-2/ATP-dependent DNA helicase PcrA